MLIPSNCNKRKDNRENNLKLFEFFLLVYSINSRGLTAEKIQSNDFVIFFIADTSIQDLNLKYFIENINIENLGR